MVVIAKYFYNSIWVMIMIDYKIIGKRIQNARLESKLTQEQLAEQLQISTNYLSKVETGREKPNLEMIDRICSNLKASLPFLLTGVVEESNTYMQTDISNLLQTCSPTKIKLIYDIISRIAEEQF